jgi:hypothetical protein
MKIFNSVKLTILLFSMLAFLCSCGIKGEKYINMQPTLRLEEFFNGSVKLWGIVQDRSGNIVNRFDATIDGQWNENKGVLDELFTYYDSGKQEKRVWKITKIDDLHYEGTANDIIGTASGRAFGNAVFWSYEMDIVVDDSSYRLAFEDWMWAMRDDVVMNRSYLKKFGITVAEVTIFMQKQ